jgi:integrase
VRDRVNELERVAGEVGLARALEAAEHARSFVRSQRTRNAYARAFTRFASWCHAQGRSWLPAEPSTVAAYLAARASQGRAVATLEQELAAIGCAHRIAGERSPREASEVRDTMRGLRRALGVAPRRRKAALLGDAVVKLCDECTDGLRGLRDRAMVLLGWHSALRPGELCALRLEDVSGDGFGGLWLELARSKTDQEARGRRVHVPAGPAGYDAVTALQAWRSRMMVGDFGPLFRAVAPDGSVSTVPRPLSARSWSRALKRRALAAGLDAQAFAGHSLRRGLVTAAALEGRAAWEIARKTGHGSEAMVSRYVDEAAAIHRDVADGLLRPSR